jgi:hypothetical protein
LYLWQTKRVISKSGWIVRENSKIHDQTPWLSSPKK